MILSYLGRVNIAVNLVKDKYPASKLYEVDGIPTKGATTDWKDIDSLKAVFTAGNNDTAIVKSTGWGEWGKVDYVHEPWVEDVVVPWPVDLELSDAVDLMKKAGYTLPFGAVTLRWPLYPGVKEPYYIFTLTNGAHVFVGCYDKSVSEHN